MFRSFLRTREGRGIAIVGLSAENVRRLREGKPVHTKMTNLGAIPDGMLAKDVDVMIVYGETEQAIADEFQGSARAALQREIGRRRAR
jgi:hypothetical protein